MRPTTGPAAANDNLRLLTITKACRQLGVARSTFYEFAAADQISIVKLGRSSRVRSDELQQLIDSLPAITVARRERR